MRRRLSLATEERIWALRCQGQLLDDIARQIGCSYGATRNAIRRARRRRMPASNPLHRATPGSPASRGSTANTRRLAFANRLLLACTP